MTKLIWGEAGKRYFRTGISKGVLYPKDLIGVPWNGLTAIDEKPTGGSPQPYYIDGEKYINVADKEEFFGTLSAITYPDEFEVCDGTGSFANGLYLEQQPRKPFDLAYVVNVGNDLEGANYGYRIHLLYNVLASPSAKSNQTMNSSVTLTPFSWDLSTTPVRIPGHAPTSHLIIDSKKTNALILASIEDILFGSLTEVARMPDITELLDLFAQMPVRIDPEFDIGISPLDVVEVDPDLKGDFSVGIFKISPDSRLKPTGIDGIYRLEE